MDRCRLLTAPGYSPQPAPTCLYRDSPWAAASAHRPSVRKLSDRSRSAFAVTLGLHGRAKSALTRDPITRFEGAVLRPIAIALAVGAVLLTLSAIWPWAIACVAGLLYLGLVGSKLRQRAVAIGMANTQQTEAGAFIEGRIPTPRLEVLAVHRACTRVGGLVGVMVAELLFKSLGWDWYPAMVVGLIALLVVRAGLKLIFCSAA